MSAPINDGGPAFPPACTDAAHAYALSKIEGITDPNERDRIYIQAKAQVATGMSLRDWFAGQALGSVTSVHWDWAVGMVSQNLGTGTPEDYIARSSYAMADAMLAARERKTEGAR